MIAFLILVYGKIYHKFNASMGSLRKQHLLFSYDKNALIFDKSKFVWLSAQF